METKIKPHEAGIKEKISEAVVLRSLDKIKQYTLKEIGEFVFLNFLVLFLLNNEKDFQTIARGHSARIKAISSNFKTFTFIGTDLYMYIHLLLYDHNKLKQTSENNLYAKRCNLTDYEIYYIIREISEGRGSRSAYMRFMLKLEKELQISDSGLKSCRRFISEWDDQSEFNKKMVVTRLLQALRTRTPNSDLLFHLESLAKKQKLEIKDANNPEKSK